MFLLKYNMLMIFLLNFSIIMSFSGNSFYFLWIFMEMNMMVFLTYMIINSEFVSIISMKYYLMSSFSSIIFMFFINMGMFEMNFFIILLINMMMLMKLGMVPFHFWFIDMMVNLNWMMCFILSTMQKIIPFLTLSYLYMYNFLCLVIFLGGMINFVMVYNHVLMKKIIGYSSINHMMWMIMSILMKFNLWMLYFYNYFMLMFILSYLFKQVDLHEIKDLYKIYDLGLMQNYLFFFLFLSLGGLPPFYGFFLKWYMIDFMSSFMMMLILIFLIIYSLVFLYFYMRLILNMMMLGGLNMNLFKINFNFNLNFGVKNLLIFFVSFNLIFFSFWLIF